MVWTKEGKIIGAGILIIVFVLFIAPSLGLFSITGNERLYYSMPSEVDAGKNFNVQFNAYNVQGDWAATVETVFNCGVYGTTNKKLYLASYEGTTKTISYSAPNEEGISCTLSGNYQFGDRNIINLQPQIVTTKVTVISHASSQCYNDDLYWYNSNGVREDKKEECGIGGCQNNACVICTPQEYFQCYNDDVYWYDSCNIRGSVKESCSDGCENNVCKICLTDADENCDGVVDRDELGTSITAWINDQLSRNDLGTIITAWANG